MKAMRVLLLVSAILLGGWSESYAETMSVMTWKYYPPFERNKTYFYEYNFTYNGAQLSPGNYTLGIIYITNDYNNSYGFGILDSSISYDTSNGYTDYQEYKNNVLKFIFIESLDVLTEPLFANAYKNENFNNYFSFGAYWSYEHDGSNSTLSIPVLFGWCTSDNIGDPPFDHYAVFYIQGSNGNIVYSHGLQVGNPPAVPLPGTALLLGSGLAGLALMSRRLRRR